MKKVTGIGGIFFKSKDPKKLSAWYGQFLGMDAGDYGYNFTWYTDANSGTEGTTVWSPFDQKTDYFKPSEKEFMINYRVENLEALVEELTAAGIAMLDEIVVYSYGKFVHFLDPEGNKIELWEPLEASDL